ncbi:MAG: DUF2764 family protein [Chlamydiales bacterium]|nr:DUF2764 family protein [Chlamydiales bacterium]
MRNYYFLTNLCPPLQLREPPEISFSELKAFFYINLAAQDYARMRALQFYIDLYNLRALWLEKPIDDKGFYSKEELEVAMVTGVGLPDYVLDFLQTYDTTEKRVHAFLSLIASYFQEEIARADSFFVKEYLTFERQSRLILAGFRSKLERRDIIEELQFEDPLDSSVAFVIAQKDAKEFEAPDGYEELKLIFIKNKSSPLELFKDLLEFRFNRIEAMKGDNPFGIDAQLAYMVQLAIVEAWQEVRSGSLLEEGSKVVDKMISTVKESA